MNEINPPNSEVVAATETAVANAHASNELRYLPFEFRATGAEYFRIWIVNLLLTIVTIGIYSAWAKVRRLRYFYGSTVLDGASFEYHGNPVAILKGRLLTVGVYAVLAIAIQFYPWVGFLALPVVALGLPWVIVRARLFQMRMSSYRGLRFNFHGNYKGALSAYVGWAVVAVLTLFFLAPIWVWRRVKFLLENTSYAGHSFRVTTPRSRFFDFCYSAVGLGFVCTVFLIIIMALLGAAGLALLVSFISSIGFLLVFFFVAAYYQRALLNASFGGLEIGAHRLRSTLETGPLLGLYLKNLILLVLTLGLYFPWAQVALLRYQIENVGLEAHGSLDDFVSGGTAGAAALGEEVGDFFDVDFGL
jgi:uncharacterized membrane protein YjgN (DUF898 family)